MATVHSSSFIVKTEGFTDVHNITEKVNEILRHSPLTRGIATVFISGSTAGVTTIEYEPGAVEDLKKAIERIAPRNLHYDHDARWGDGNGFSHVRASLLGPSLTLPFSDRHLQIGTWQQLILVDFDNRPRTREILVQLVGE